MLNPAWFCFAATQVSQRMVTLARGFDDALRVRQKKKCPSGITMFNGRPVHGCGFSVSYMAAQIYRPEENDSLASRRERASERAYRNLRVDEDNPGSRIDTGPRWNWHIHLSPGICMACMGKSRREATPRDWPCIIHRISVERPKILNNKSVRQRFFRSNPRVCTAGCPRILHFVEISQTREVSSCRKTLWIFASKISNDLSYIAFTFSRNFKNLLFLFLKTLPFYYKIFKIRLKIKKYNVQKTHVYFWRKTLLWSILRRFEFEINKVSLSNLLEKEDVKKYWKI